MKILLHWKLCIAFAAVIAISCSGTIYAQVWANSGNPIPIVVHHIKVEKNTGGSHLLILKASGPPTQGCLRFTQHLLIRKEDGLRDYVPLGAAINGMGFSSAEDYKVTLEIPAAIPLGNWQYVNRSVYFCTVWPGLVSVIRSISSEIMINLD